MFKKNPIFDTSDQYTFLKMSNIAFRYFIKKRKEAKSFSSLRRGIVSQHKHLVTWEKVTVPCHPNT